VHAIIPETNGDYQVDESRFIVYRVDPRKGKLRLYWKDDAAKNISSLDNLRQFLVQKNDTLVFAMNGGMYNQDQSPQGLYVEESKLISPMDRKEKGYGNFYLQPNGIFSLTKSGDAAVTPTKSFKAHPEIHYATQSGPMLLIDSLYHPKLKKGSSNLHIRNGVGVLPNGELLFAMSKEKTNFYDLATLFRQNGCRNALYLDGFVSRTYLPAKDWVQLDGKFGVIIGELK
ncbi:MAG: phosphodiester glycosidase family protein, partial [Bacteroidota bacterium]